MAEEERRLVADQTDQGSDSTHQHLSRLSQHLEHKGVRIKQDQGGDVISNSKVQPTLRLVFPDLIAFRYLQEDRSVTVVEHDAELAGYELFLVEQWACSRIHPTFFIVTSTGLTDHRITVGVLEVPRDERLWSNRLRGYLKAVSNHYARRKETPLGTIIVTNLSSFPSSLTVITVPDGNLKDYRENFVVNENMKRLGCSGRAGLTLGPLSTATEAKFMQLYRVSDRINISDAVIELVRLCQIALMMFMKLDAEVADGLFCDLTERALNNWWHEIGMEYFTIEPSDGPLGPTTVASLLGLFIGARNRLNAYGSPVSKDAFDLKPLKRGISYFQKSQKLTRTRRLDYRTLDRLHRTTSKAASSEGWAVPKAVKSTVAELSGKGGEMVMGIVGAREKAGIAEVETLDIGKFTESLSGERCRRLWHGRPRKTQASDLLNNFGGEEENFVENENQWIRKRDALSEVANLSHGSTQQFYSHVASSQSSLDASDQDHALHRGVLKSMTGRMSDAKTGLGKFRDVVGISGRKTYLQRPRKDLTFFNSSQTKGWDASLQGRISAHHTSPQDLNKVSSRKFHGKQPSNIKPVRDDIQSDGLLTGSDTRNSVIKSEQQSAVDSTVNLTKTNLLVSVSKENGHHDEEYEPLDSLNEPLHKSLRTPNTQLRPKARMSMQTIRPRDSFTPMGKFATLLTRHASFSLVEDALLHQRSENLSGGEDVGVNPSSALAGEKLAFLVSRRVSLKLSLLDTQDSQLTQDHLTYINQLVPRADRDLEDIRAVQQQKQVELNDVNGLVTRIIKEGKSSLSDDLKEVEVLGAKLEYELNALVSKIEDVEEGVLDFERQIIDLEERARDLGSSDSAKRSLWQSFGMTQ